MTLLPAWQKRRAESSTGEPSAKKLLKDMIRSMRSLLTGGLRPFQAGWARWSSTPCMSQFTATTSTSSELSLRGEQQRALRRVVVSLGSTQSRSDSRLRDVAAERQGSCTFFRANILPFKF